MCASVVLWYVVVCALAAYLIVLYVYVNGRAFLVRIPVLKFLSGGWCIIYATGDRSDVARGNDYCLVGLLSLNMTYILPPFYWHPMHALHCRVDAEGALSILPSNTFQASLACSLLGRHSADMTTHSSSPCFVVEPGRSSFPYASANIFHMSEYIFPSMEAILN